MNSENPVRPHYPALDGLRGIAILLVLLFHNFGFVSHFFFLGQLGVDLFFVLSGFLITDILIHTVTKKNYLKNFYARRILRIFPPYYLFLVITLLVLPAFRSGSDLTYYLVNQKFFWTYTQNWLFVFNDPAPNNLLLPLWSLAVEEQFYLLWPLAILACKSSKRALIFITGILLLYINSRYYFWQHPFSPPGDYGFFIYTRIDGICVGCMVALLRQLYPGLIRKYSLRVLVFLILINLAFFIFSGLPLLSYQYLSLLGFSSFAVFFGLLINKIVSSDQKDSKSILENKTIRFIGKISYSIYIYHLPVYLFTLSFFLPKLTKIIPDTMANLVISVFSAIIIFVIAWLSYRFYERYFLNIKKKFT